MARGSFPAFCSGFVAVKASRGGREGGRAWLVLPIVVPDLVLLFFSVVADEQFSPFFGGSDMCHGNSLVLLATDSVCARLTLGNAQNALPYCTVYKPLRTGTWTETGFRHVAEEVL